MGGGWRRVGGLCRRHRDAMVDCEGKRSAPSHGRSARPMLGSAGDGSDGGWQDRRNVSACGFDERQTELIGRGEDESEDSFRRRMAGLDAERIARCSFCRKHDWEVGRLVAGGDGRAFLCDECEAMVHVVMTATPVPAPLGRPPVVCRPIRIDWQKLPHRQTHERR